MLQELWFWTVNIGHAVCAAVFDDSQSVVDRAIAAIVFTAAVALPCTALALVVIRAVRAFRRAVQQAEQDHPLVLVGFGGEVARALAKAAKQRDALAPDQMSLPRLSEALEAAETLLLHARKVRELDKARRKASWLLQLVDAATYTHQEEALNHAAGRYKLIQQHAQDRARSHVQARLRSLVASAATDVAEERHLALAEIHKCTREAERASTWAELALEAGSAMLAAERQCRSASTTELVDLFSKSKAIAAWSTLDTQAASEAVARANRAARALQRTLPDRETLLLASVPVPCDVFDLILDFSLSPTLDIMSLFTMSALGDAATRCRRAAEKLHEFADRAASLAATASAAAQRANATKEAVEAPFLSTARNEVPNRLRQLL